VLEPVATGSSSLFAVAGGAKVDSGTFKRWHKSTEIDKRFAVAQRSRALPERPHLKQWNVCAFVLIDRDYLTCPVGDINRTHVLKTFVGGKMVFERKE
jgi:hypothetical protein